MVERPPIQRRRERIREPKRQHWRDPTYSRANVTTDQVIYTTAQDSLLTPCIFEREAPLVHLILLHLAPPEEVHAPSRVALHRQVGRVERPLLTDQDIEVIVGGVDARVPLRPERRPEHDQVLRHARVQDEHRAHCAARVVKHPLGRVRVERDLGGGVGRGEVRDDVLDH